MQDRIKEHYQDIRLARTQTSAVSVHHPLWTEAKFTDGDSHCYTSPVKEAIYRRFHPNIKIPEEWIPTVKKRNNTTGREGTTSHQKCKDRNLPTTGDIVLIA